LLADLELAADPAPGLVELEAADALAEAREAETEEATLFRL
jgi:hypothetical protein